MVGVQRQVKKENQINHPCFLYAFKRVNIKASHFKLSWKKEQKAEEDTMGEIEQWKHSWWKIMEPAEKKVRC